MYPTSTSQPSYTGYVPNSSTHPGPHHGNNSTRAYDSRSISHANASPVPVTPASVANYPTGPSIPTGPRESHVYGGPPILCDLSTFRLSPTPPPLAQEQVLQADIDAPQHQQDSLQQNHQESYSDPEDMNKLPRLSGIEAVAKAYYSGQRDDPDLWLVRAAQKDSENTSGNKQTETGGGLPSDYYKRRGPQIHPGLEDQPPNNGCSRDTDSTRYDTGAEGATR